LATPYLSSRSSSGSSVVASLNTARSSREPARRRPAAASGRAPGQETDVGLAAVAASRQGAENPALQPPRRHKEKAWRRAHETELGSYAGQWVVLEGEMIVAHGTKPAEVLECAKSKGVRIPYVFYVEELEPDVAIMGL
jgi:hypothetical protein